ncbi:MAG: ornithine cyclodeaminase [Rhodobacteraceae bacterium]|nr:ornithine cyclodeaminase [Paracoccaceae bacterium]
MQFADAARVHALLDYPGLVDALAAAHRGPVPVTRSTLVEGAARGEQFITIVGWGPGALACKVISVFPGNPGRPDPLPSVQGLVCVFDPRTGAPVMACDGAAITVRKTAADSALGARLLARKGARTLLVVGAGAMAPAVAAAHCAVRPSIRRVLLWNRNPGRAHALAAALDLPGREIAVVADLDAAVPAAEVISCVTMAERPLIRGALLAPGTHLDLVGSYLPAMREADDDCLTRGRLFVDMRKETQAGELLDPIRRGVIGWDTIRGDLFELVQGRAEGRRSEDEITVYKNLGGGHLDMYTAAHLWQRMQAA